jgi:hypothetical protein
MSKENLSLWVSVQETNPADTKPVSFGRKFTAIDAYSQIKKATEIFGSYGTGWGIKSIVHTFVPNTNMVMGEAQFFYRNENTTNGEFPVTSSILYISEKGKIDDDFAKKLETDMITKALSRLGFNADVFMGKFDDNRYVTQMKEKFEQIDPAPINQAHVQSAYEAFKAVVDNASELEPMDYKRVQSGWARISNDEQIALFDLFGSDKPEGSRKGYKAIIKDLLAMSEADLVNAEDYASV